MNKKIFVDSYNYFKSLLIVGLIIIPPLFYMFKLDSNSNNPMTALIPLIGLPVMLVILFPLFRIVVGNNAVYILMDGVLYQINRMPEIFRFITNTMSLSERLLENNVLLEEVLENTYTYKINKTVSMKKFFNGYKVVINMSNRNTNDEENICYLFPGYNDYDMLVKCLKELM